MAPKVEPLGAWSPGAVLYLTTLPWRMPGQGLRPRSWWVCGLLKVQLMSLKKEQLDDKTEIVNMQV